MASEAGDVTQLLHDWRSGDDQARDRLVDALYEELRRIARRHLRGEAPGHTINTTGLVHEAYVGLMRADAVSAQDRAHFLATASRVMRHVLIDHARARASAKRGGGRLRVPLSEDVAEAQATDTDVLDLDRALDRLADQDGRMARIVECRFYGGMTIEETSVAVGAAPRTVRREWTRARAWLFRELRGGPPSEAAT